MADIKISQLTAKSANLDSTDLFEVSELNGVDYVSKKITGQEIINGVLSGVSDLPHAIASGTNTYTATIPGITVYTDGDAYLIRFTNANDDNSTLDINGLGAINLVKKANTQVTGGDIVDGQEILVIYDGTNFQCIQTTANQLFAYVTNADSVTITKGQPVYAFGSAGNRMSVKLANNTGDATSAQTVGLVFSSSIAAGQKGFVITQGVIDGLNTGTYSDGDQLYLGATAGALTNVKPYAPNHLVYVGIVERANAGNGQIYVKPQNGYELDELHDVDLISTPPQNGDVLTFNSVTGLWEATPIPGLNTGGTQLLSGGASWSGTGMLFNVSFLTYTIDGDYYSSVPQNVTLTVGDPSNPRFDAIVVDDTGVVSVITGTPAANPLVPSVSGTQVLVQYVLVGAGQVTPSITNEFVYREGSSPDWTPVAIPGAAPSLTANFSSLTPVPFQGTQCTLVNAPSYTTSKLIQYTKPSGSIVRSSFPFLAFRAQLLAGSENRNILVRLYNGTTLIGTAWSSNYGLSISTTGVWQLVVIPLTVFGNAGITTVTRVQFLFSGTVVGTTQIALDDIKFQSGYGPQSSAATFDIAQNGTVIGDTSRLNFINGTNTTVTVTDDIPNNKIDVQINATAITSLQGVTAASQTFAVGNGGTDFAINTLGSVHVFALPTASAVNRGALSSADWTTFNNKLSQAYQTVENQGTPLTQRSNINFTGAGVTTTDTGGKTVVTINGTSGANNTVQLFAAQPLTATGLSSANVGLFTVTFPNQIVYGLQQSGGGAGTGNIWYQLVIPNNFSSGGQLKIVTRRNYTTGTATLTLYIDGVASNISASSCNPTAINTWETFTFNLSTAVVAGASSISIAVTPVVNISGGTFFIKDLTFNYLS
jgi:hypothetical protein